MKKLKIALIVSTNDDIRKRFSGLLERIEVSYILESDRTSAVARIMEVPVKLLIADMLFEKENGFDFLSIVKKVRPRLPIIAITDDPSEEGINRLLDKGVMTCLVQPMDEKEIIEMVGTVLEM